MQQDEKKTTMNDNNGYRQVAQLVYEKNSRPISSDRPGISNDL
jgi:hypothetical protein